MPFLLMPGLALPPFTAPAFAHATEQPFVLLLPTGLYISAGVAAVVATLLLLGIPAIGSMTVRWRGFRLGRAGRFRLSTHTSTLSFFFLLLLIYGGFRGPTDPLANPLPLVIWTGWWIVLVLAQALAGDLWRWLNPWTGPYRILRRLGPRPMARLPRALGAAPGILLFILFALFLIADLAPVDPRRLALILSAYVVLTFAGMILFGARTWLTRVEFVSIFMGRFAALAPFALRGRRIFAGVPGWQVLAAGPTSLSPGLFVLAMLATGSFESLYTTFRWLSFIGVNPLEFPGRSAIVGSSTLGLLLCIALVIGAFALVVWAGLALAGETRRFGEAFRRQAQCVLPIVVGYHFAHYLTALLIDGQYLLIALADYVGFEHFHATTGFLNTRDSVQAIWLTQAGAVVGGHILAILLSHAVALEMFGSHRRANLSQIPISLFMVAYTFFGLWLLAAPRGM